MFPAGSVTAVELPATFYDPMRRYEPRPAAPPINRASPAEMGDYLRAIVARALPLAIGRVTPIQIYLVHDPSAGFLAIYNRDPFRGCQIVWMGVTRRFVDPCHGSEYTQLGAYLRGPAPRDLDRFAVVVTADGEIVINVNEYYSGMLH